MTTQPSPLMPRAAFRPGPSFHYAKDQEQSGDKGKDDADDKEGDDKPSLPQTQEELDGLIEAALEQREKEKLAARKAKEKKAKRQADPEEDDEDGDDEEDAAEIIRKAMLAKAKAEQERDAAVRDSQLAKVKDRLREYLLTNHRAYLANDVDIMAHIEKALPANAKDGEIGRLIESHSKAFVERVKSAARPASGAPGGGARRGNLASLVGAGRPDPDDDGRRTVVTPKGDAAPRKAFSQIHWNG